MSFVIVKINKLYYIYILFRSFFIIKVLFGICICMSIIIRRNILLQSMTKSDWIAHWNIYVLMYICILCVYSFNEWQLKIDPIHNSLDITNNKRIIPPRVLRISHEYKILKLNTKSIFFLLFHKRSLFFVLKQITFSLQCCIIFNNSYY